METSEDSYEEHEHNYAEKTAPNISVDPDELLDHVSPHESYGSPSENDSDDAEEDPWYPFLSRAHF